MFGVDLKGIVLGALGGQLNPLTLHKVTNAIGSYGEAIASEADYAGEGVRSKWDTNTEIKRGYPTTTVKLIVMQDGLPEPSTDDRITILGEKYRVTDIAKDPVNATWVMAGHRA